MRLLCLVNMVASLQVLGACALPRPHLADSKPGREAFPGFLGFLLGLCSIKRPTDPFQKGGDLPSAYADGVEGEDGLGKLQGCPFPIGEDPGMEIAFPYAGNFEILQGAYEGEEVTGVIAVGLGGVVFQ